MKKILCMILALCLTVSCGIGVFAYTDINEEHKAAQAIYVLSDLGVLDGFEDGSFRPNEMVTRAQMAKIICRATAHKNIKATDTVFSDVDASHWASGFINVANNKQIVVGYGDGTFKPEEQVSFEAAVKMIVCALGYEVDAKDNGGWPAGYVAYADKLGLLDGLEEFLVDTSVGCDRAIVAMLVYNALDVEIQDVIYYNGEILSKKGSGKTMANEMGYTKFTDAMVKATDKVVISGQLQDAGYVLINDIEMKAGLCELDNYLGQKVSLYASYNRKDEEYTVISVIGASHKSDNVILDASDIYNMEGSKLYYYIDKETSSKTSDYLLADLTDLVIVYNNDIVSLADQDFNLITETKNGTITLIDAEKDGVYEKVIIDSYKNYQVVEVDTEENILYLQDTKDETEVVLDNSRETNRPKFSIKTVDGLNLRLEDLNEKDVLSIYSDVYPEEVKNGKDYVKDADSLRIIVCDEVVEGAVTSIGKKLYIDDRAYNTDGDLTVSAFSIDDEGTFFLDFNGDIAFADTTAVLDNFEFVYDGIVDGRQITLYTMNENGKKVSYDMASTVRVNGKSYSMSSAEDRSALATALKIKETDGLKSEYVVSLKTNEDNDITRITILNEEDDRGYLTHTDKLLGNYVVDSKTVIFTLPSGEDFKEEDLKTVKYNELKNNTSYNFKVCDIDKNGIVTCVIVYTTTGKVDFEGNIAVIQSVATTKINDEVVLSLTMIQNGKIVTKNTETDDIFFINNTYEEMYGESAAIAYGAYPGQIIMYSETAGNIVNVDRVYPRPCLANEYFEGYYLVDKFQTWDNTFSKNDYARLYLGAGVVADKNTNTKIMTVDSNSTFVANYSSANIVVVDTNLMSDEAAVKIGSASDIKVGDYVVVRKYKGTVRDIVVYKNFEAFPKYYK